MGPRRAATHEHKLRADTQSIKLLCFRPALTSPLRPLQFLLSLQNDPSPTGHLATTVTPETRTQATLGFFSPPLPITQSRSTHSCSPCWYFMWLIKLLCCKFVFSDMAACQSHLLDLSGTNDTSLLLPCMFWRPGTVHWFSVVTLCTEVCHVWMQTLHERRNTWHYTAHPSIMVQRLIFQVCEKCKSMAVSL